MSLGYQRQDLRVIDYDMWYLPDLPEALRGPRRYSGKSDYLSFIGAAQTFGRFVERPFPAMVAAQLGIDHLNFGFGGAGPAAFAEHDRMLGYVNRSGTCIIQVMSGRSVTTPLMRAVGKGGIVEFTAGPAAGKTFVARAGYEVLLRDYGKEAVAEQVECARRQWIEDYNRLFDKIKVPALLVWISERMPAYVYSDRSVTGVFGSFPQMIDQQTLDAVAPRANALVHAVYPKARPQFLRNKLTGAPEPVYSTGRYANYPFRARYVNVYYPPPEAHELISAKIVGKLST